MKVSGVIAPGTLAGIDEPFRFTLNDADAKNSIRIVYAGALSDDVKEGSAVVLTGSLGKDGNFTATDVALEG